MVDSVAMSVDTADHGLGCPSLCIDSCPHAVTVTINLRGLVSEFMSPVQCEKTGQLVRRGCATDTDTGQTEEIVTLFGCTLCGGDAG